MTAPLELPELGPYLGRLADATRRFEDPAVGLDLVRLNLVTELFERAGVARGFLLTGDRDGARAALDRTTWLTLWRGTANQAADLTMVAVASRLEHAARRSRYPRAKLAAALPTGEDKAVLAAKLEAAGIPLEERLARGLPGGVGWWDGIRQAAVALEDSWEALEDDVRLELATATATARRIEQWRPGLAPWYLALGGLLVAATWLGLALGGYLPRPAWLDRFGDWFWSLPWP